MASKKGQLLRVAELLRRGPFGSRRAHEERPALRRLRAVFRMRETWEILEDRVMCRSLLP